MPSPIISTRRTTYFAARPLSSFAARFPNHISQSEIRIWAANAKPIDPLHDTPEVLTAYARQWLRVDPHPGDACA